MKIHVCIVFFLMISVILTASDPGQAPATQILTPICVAHCSGIIPSWHNQDFNAGLLDDPCEQHVSELQPNFFLKRKNLL